MKNSLLILTFFVAGILAGRTSLMPEFLLHKDLSLYVLYVLLVLVGVGIGGDQRTWKIIRNANITIVLVPVTVIIGTLAGTALVAGLLDDISLRESLAVGTGFGYYSLSSIIISKIHSDALGVVALLSNIIREIFTLLFTPLLARFFGKLAPICSGGATAMDTTLPIITKFTGKEYAMIAVFSGLVLSLLVPILVPIILGR